MDNLDAYKFSWMIRKELEDHPEWLGLAVQAISSGMEAAMRKKEAKYTKLDLAFRSALILVAPGRMDAATKNMLLEKVQAAIDPENTCNVERDTLAMSKYEDK